MERTHRFTYREYLEAAQAPSPMPTRDRSSRTGSQRFTGTASFEEAVSLAKTGWPEGYERVMKEVEEVYDVVTDRVEAWAPTHGVTGAAPNMGRYMSREPEHMRRMVPTDAEDHTVEITVNTSASGRVSKDVIFRRGAAIVALIDALENQGKRVGLTVVDSTRGGGRTVHTAVRVKDPDHPLDVDRVTFALCHPAWLRRLWFSFAETWDRQTREKIDVGDGYGTPASYPEPEQGDVHLPKALGSDAAWEDADKAAAWVLEHLEEQGVEVERPA